jgi:hypothetical protein
MGFRDLLQANPSRPWATAPLPQISSDEIWGHFLPKEHKQSYLLLVKISSLEIL